MEEIFTRDNVLGDNIYRQVLRPDPPTKEELLSANLLRMVNTTTYKGMTAATLKRSTKLKAKLLKNFKNPRREFGGLWCWVVCSHHGPRSGCVMRLVTINDFMGLKNTFYTFRTADSFDYSDPSDHGTKTLHAGEFQLLWVSVGFDLVTGETLKGWELEIDSM